MEHNMEDLKVAGNPGTKVETIGGIGTLTGNETTTGTIVTGGITGNTETMMDTSLFLFPHSVVLNLKRKGMWPQPSAT